MVRPYSLDLRERVVAVAGSGQPCRAVGKRSKPRPCGRIWCSGQIGNSHEVWWRDGASAYILSSSLPLSSVYPRSPLRSTFG
jgi:hypothetical protein